MPPPNPQPSPFEMFKLAIAQFELQTKQLSKTPDVWLPINPNSEVKYNQTRTELGKILYSFTKNLLNTNFRILTAKEKGLVLKAYITAWRKAECTLRLEDIGYEADTEALFDDRGLRMQYPQSYPMIAGFNLSHAQLVGYNSDLIFINVNFDHADFSETSWPYAHFYHCSMRDISSSYRTNLGQSQFHSCNLISADLTQAALDEVVIKKCSVFNSQFPRSVRLDPSNVKSAPYPEFLKNLKVSPKDLTPSRVAHALWLSDKNARTTQASKSQFSLWATAKKLPFSIDEVKAKIDRTYTMK